MVIFEKVREKLFPKPKKSEEVSKNKTATFILMHLDLHLGTLELNDGIWSFEYSFIYKQRLKKAIASGSNEDFVQPLFAFPDINKKYTSEKLWPFFTARIPGLKQPEVQKIMKKDKIESTDLVALLKRFGRKTIINPFELTVQ